MMAKVIYTSKADTYLVLQHRKGTMDGWNCPTAVWSDVANTKPGCKHVGIIKNKVSKK